jgi:hypothetical protein
MVKELTPEELGKKLRSAGRLDPPDIHEVVFEVRSMGHFPPQGFAALTAAEVAAKDWIANRMITVEWNYHVPTHPEGVSEANLKDFLDRLKGDDGEKAVHEHCRDLGFHYLGTHRLGFLSFEQAGPFKTIFAFKDDTLLDHFLALPSIPAGIADAATWQRLEGALDENFRKWIGRTSPMRITTYRPAISWNSAQR